jgi:hypothetical protein
MLKLLRSKLRPRSRLRALARFVDHSVNPFHGEVSVNEDRSGTGEWRVEYFDDDGGCYVTIFAGPAAERRARDLRGGLAYEHVVDLSEIGRAEDARDLRLAVTGRRGDLPLFASEDPY